MTEERGTKRCCTPASGREGAVAGAVTDVAVGGSTQGMIRVASGRFLMGNEDADAWLEDGEGPVREVRLDAFFLDATAVTNAAFAQFVDASGYITEAERFAWSYVHQSRLPNHLRRRIGQDRTVAGLRWWYAVEGACWRKPEGPGSNIKRRMDHPVVHVSWNDAEAYCRWAGKRLPTEAEWECAARGGLEQRKYPWGDELTPAGKHRCNIWQGRFPDRDTGEDGYRGTAPARAFRPNAFGFYNMSGNVWEWCADWFSPTWGLNGSRENPRGPDVGEAKVMKGGSYLCHHSYCNRYRVGARTANTSDSSTGNCGFRCVVDVSDSQCCIVSH